MGGGLPTAKLDWSNYTSREYKMHQYLLEHDYQSYIHGENEVAPKSTHKDFPAWEQTASRVLYCLLQMMLDDNRVPVTWWKKLEWHMLASKIEMTQNINVESFEKRQN